MKNTFMALLSLTLSAFITQAAFTQTTFSYTGSVQSYTVPAGVASIQIETWGAQGANATFGTAGTGGLGGYTIGELSVTGGEVLNIYVGGQNGYNGGGIGGIQGNASSQNGPSAGPGANGGGASDVRQSGTTLNDRVIVGAGGGGAGNDGNWSGCQPSLGVSGGDGGALDGATGTTANLSAACNCVGGGGVGGAGASQSAGGAAGAYQGGCLTGAWVIGQGGSLGFGGDGDQSAPYAGDGAGGGGGGGYYGGGSGGDGVNTTSGAGGGGGSSYFGGVTNATTTAGLQTGDGSIVITILCDGLTTTVSATTVCFGETVTLHAESTNGGTITWDNGITDSVAFIPAVGATTYTATSTDVDDCSFSQLITVNDIPAVDAGSDINICTEGIDTMLTGSGAVTYVWDNGITDGFSFTPPFGVTTYTVTGTDANNCENTDDLVISIGGPAITALITNESVGNDGAIDINVTGGSGSFTYVWSNGPTTQDIAALTAGTYTVTVDDGLCTSDSTFTILNVLGIESLVEKGITVYPNPTDGIVNIQLEGEFTYVIRNLLGQKIITGAASGSDKIDLDLFENGVYFIQISDGNLEQTVKLVKQ
jgi:hypothetical protein